MIFLEYIFRPFFLTKTCIFNMLPFKRWMVVMNVIKEAHEAAEIV